MSQLLGAAAEPAGVANRVAVLPPVQLLVGEQDAGRRILDVWNRGQHVEVKAVVGIGQSPAPATRLAGLRPVGVAVLLLPSQVRVQQVADALLEPGLGYG